MRNKSVFVLSIAVLLAMVGAAFGQPWLGSGTAEDPYRIYDANDMQAIGADPNFWDAHFKLMQDINLSSFDGLEGRPAFNIIGYRRGEVHLKPFSGVFDGNSNKILNFTYRSSKTDLIGLFGFLGGENAEIKNLGLINSKVVAGTGYYAGSLVGQVGFPVFGFAGGTIAHCYVEGGSVKGNECVGGLVGMVEEARISNCRSSVFVEGYESVGGLVGKIRFDGIDRIIISNCGSSGTVSGNEHIGGLVGACWGGWVSSFVNISECYSSCDISGYQNVGGLVGLIVGGTIANCYTTGSIQGYDYVGGLIGTLMWGSTIVNSYAASGLEGIIDVGGLVGSDGGGELWDGYAGDYTGCFWDNTVNPALTGLGNKEDPPDVIGKPTMELQMESTFTSVGWDFATPIWKMCDVPDYPKLWWEECPRQVIRAEIEIKPDTINLQNRGKWITCLIQLPEDYNVADIDPNSVFLEDEIVAQQLWIDGQVAIAKFSRSEVQDILSVGEVELTVSGELVDGTKFVGGDTIKVIDKRRTR